MNVKVVREVRWPDGRGGEHVALAGQELDLSAEVVKRLGSDVVPLGEPRKKARKR